jgi:hypothetical protein
MNLDNEYDFRIALRAALELGEDHTEIGAKRVTNDKLLAILTDRFGQMTCRRFHGEILNRAYGLSFVNAKKMAWVRAKAARENPQSA